MEKLSDRLEDWHVNSKAALNENHYDSFNTEIASRSLQSINAITILKDIEAKADSARHAFALMQKIEATCRERNGAKHGFTSLQMTVQRTIFVLKDQGN